MKSARGLKEFAAKFHPGVRRRLCNGCWVFLVLCVCAIGLGIAYPFVNRGSSVRATALVVEEQGAAGGDPPPASGAAAGLAVSARLRARGRGAREA